MLCHNRLKARLKMIGTLCHNNYKYKVFSSLLVSIRTSLLYQRLILKTCIHITSKVDNFNFLY